MLYEFAVVGAEKFRELLGSRTAEVVEDREDEPVSLDCGSGVECSRLGVIDDVE